MSDERLPSLRAQMAQNACEACKDAIHECEEQLAFLEEMLAAMNVTDENTNLPMGGVEVRYRNMRNETRRRLEHLRTEAAAAAIVHQRYADAQKAPPAETRKKA